MFSGPYQEVAAVTQSLKSVAASTDERFVEIGKRLAPATGTLEGITAVFEALSAKLSSEHMADATRDLTQAASHVSRMADSMRGQRSVITNLKAAIDAISGNLSHMRQTVTLVDILAKNGKIQAANIDRAEIDFSVFTKEVDRMVTLARGSLEGLNQDLTHLDRELNAASVSHDEFEKHQAEAISNIPKWLAESVEFAAAHGRRAAEAATTVREKSQQVGQKIGAAVVALQIGDATRQRIEHVEEALGLLCIFLAPRVDGARKEDEWWRSLNGDQQKFVIAEVCGLQAAQLTHTAQEFQTEIAQIISALEGLAADARAILQLSNEAYGASDQRRASFLVELEENVRRALDLLRGFHVAHDHANRFAGSVLNSVMRSSEHVEMVRSLEVDLRLLGLNMTLKCNRLGEAGRALSTIAQELRDCADRTTEDARIVMDGLDGITKVADQMAGRDQSSKADDVGAVENTMTESVRHFSEAGQHIAKALATLAQDGNAVASGLEDTVFQINFHDEIVRVLRQAAASLNTIVQKTAIAIENVEDVERIKHEIGAHFNARYTMASERAIHQRMSRETASDGLFQPSFSPDRPSDPTAAMLDDVLF